MRSPDTVRSSEHQRAVLSDLIEESWAALTSGDDDVISSPPLISGRVGHPPSKFAVEDIATASVATALRAATALTLGAPPSPIRLDRSHVADACRSERFFAVDGQTGAGFAPVNSGFGPQDGWVRAPTPTTPGTEERSSKPSRCPPTPTRSSRPSGRLLLRCGAKTSKTGSLPRAVSARWSALSTYGAAIRKVTMVAAEPLSIACETFGDALSRPTPARLRVLDLTQRHRRDPICTRLIAALEPTCSGSTHRFTATWHLAFADTPLRQAAAARST